jgi:predicted RNase H-like HicB family nuclease
VRYTGLEMARYLVIYERSGGGGVGAFSPDLPGCIANARTLDELRPLMKDAMRAHLETLRAEGLDVPEGRPADETAAGAEMVDVDDAEAGS